MRSYLGSRITATTNAPPWLFNFPSPGADGFSLPVVYLAWAGIVLFLWPFCYWFAGFKRRHKDWVILSYL